MLVTSLLLVVVTLAAAAPPKTTAGKNVFCYYYNWALYRSGDCAYKPDDADANLCTHIIYAYATTSGDTSPRLSSSDPNADLPEGYDGYNKITALKEQNPDLKVLLASGGFNAGGIPFSQAFHTKESRDNYAINTIEFLKAHNFDGLSIDWMWPGNGSPADFQNLALVAAVLREAYDKEGMLVVTTVSASPQVMDKYDADGLNSFHFVNVLSLDFRGYWDHLTGPPTAIYKCDEDTLPNADELNADHAVQTYLKAGVNADQLLIGTATEGRSFKLSDPADHKIGSPTTGWGGDYQPCTLTNGVIGYNEFCLIPNSGWEHVEAPECAAEYHYKGDQWISLESATTMYAHGAYAASNGLAGGTVWSLDTDDFVGLCGDKYPLINALKEGINGGEVSTTTSGPKTTTTEGPTPDTTTEGPTPDTTTTTEGPTPDTTTTNKGPTTSGGCVPECTKEGFIRNRCDCQIYYECEQLPDGTFWRHEHRCADELVFNLVVNVCDFLFNVPECQ